MWSEDTPNPGSDEAVKRGCFCPVLDNNYGEGLGEGKFWLIVGCPLHYPIKETGIATTDAESRQTDRN